MSGEPFQCGYGAIVQEDVDVLEACLSTLSAPTKVIKVLEIGMHDGGTAKGIEHFVTHRLGCALEYWGIDPDPGASRPRHIPKDGRVVIGDSAEVFYQVPDSGFDLIWVDGCHCFNHVVLDTVLYAPKLRLGGFICYHDVNPAGEGLEHQYHGPQIPHFGLAVNRALFDLKPWMDHHYFIHFMQAWPVDRHNCGTRAFRRE